MTSPVGGQPEPTQDRYDDVHSRGSSFGAELNESAVRGILSSQVESPFASVAISVANAFGSLISDVADAISGIIPDGARTEPIKNAIVAKIGPLESEVLALGESLSALSEETMGRIDAQKGLIDDATAAVNEAKDAVAAVKAVADQNKLDITEAVSKAEKASADLAALAPQITAAINAANKASSDVSTLTPKVTAAKEEAAKASQDIAALSPKVTDAVSKSEKATSDVAALTPKVSAAQSKADEAYTEAGNVRSEVTPLIKDAQTKGQEALSTADKAVSWLRNPNEIGTSVIAINPETDRPYYADPLELVDDNPPKTSGPTYMRPKSEAGKSTYGPQVPVDPKIKYTVSFWAKADEPGSVLYGQLRSQEGRSVAPDGTSLSVGAVNVAAPPQPSNKGEDGKYVHGAAANSYFIQDLELQTEWTYYEHEIEFTEGVTSISISVMYWNHTRGISTNQYISGLDIRPQIPTQASVDQAQNDAIKANQDILRQQEEINEAQRVANLAQKNFNDNQTKWNTASSNATKALQDAAKAQEDINAEQTKFNNFQTDFNKKQTAWNEAVDRSLATQGVVNDNFDKWTDGADTAIQANTSAIKALGKIDTGESLIAYLTPTDAEVRAGTAKYDVPVWTTGAHREFSGQNPPPEHVKYAYGASSTDDTKSPKTVPVAVRPGTKYILSFWAYGSGNMVIYMYGNGGYPIRSTRQLKVNQETLQIEKDSGGKRIYDPARNGNSSSSTGTQWLLNGFAPDELHKWVHYKFEVEFTEPTTEVRLDRFYWNWRETSVDGQYLGDMQFYPDVPTQADIDEAQNKAIQANSEFAKQQVEINQLLQEQLWTQQDMVEQLDLQATKIYHGEVSSIRTSGIPSWVGWSSATEHIFPLVHFYTRNDTDRMFKWQLTGSWTGRVKTTTNWSNGAVDVAVFDVTTSGVSQGGSYSRTQTTSGGAWGVNLRNVTFEVFPTSLDRECSVAAFDGKHSVIEDEKVSGFPSMVRYQGDQGIRFSCPVKCNKELTLDVFEDGKWVSKTYPTYRMIMPTLIKWSQIPTSATFTEAKVYSL